VAQLNNRYARAIFDLSIERGALKENLDQALFMRDVLDEEDCQSIITHPRISANEKRSFFDEVFSERVSNDLLGFLHLAVSKNRTAYIVPALDSFINMAHDHLRKATALVVSAVPLREEQISALAVLLSNKTSKQVNVEQKVDPTVIGGLYIQVDGYFIDRTLKTRLQEIRNSLEQQSTVAP
jgi:F-type H+-transporting ATPase subunit delta